MKINIRFGYYKLNLFKNIKQETNINMSLNIFIELFNKKRTRHFFSHLLGQRCYLEAPYELASPQTSFGVRLSRMSAGRLLMSRFQHRQLRLYGTR